MNSMTDLVVPSMKSLIMCEVPRYKRCPFYLTQDLFCRLSMVYSFKAIAGGMHAGIYYRVLALAAISSNVEKPWCTSRLARFPEFAFCQLW